MCAAATILWITLPAAPLFRSFIFKRKKKNSAETAADEEVKKAYMKLARKYHPDNYHDNPLADLAQEKMKEINAAYEQITKSRSGGQRSGYNTSYGGYSDRGSWNSQSSSGSSVLQ